MKKSLEGDLEEVTISTLERSVQASLNQFDTFQTPGKPGASEPAFEIQRSLRGARGRKGHFCSTIPVIPALNQCPPLPGSLGPWTPDDLLH